MTHYKPATYGDEIAEVYDQLYASFDPACIERLAELAASGPALELGIGTGRIALPLLERGVAIEGLDASQAMMAKLKDKPHSTEIPLHFGSFEDFNLQRQYSLVFVVFNSFFNLQAQEEQVRCFQSVARHLTPQGSFVIEAFVPDLCRYTDFQAVRLVGFSDPVIRIDVAELDPVAQHVESRHLMVTESGLRTYPVKLRYAWPAELDLMARLAGLRLRERWASWKKEPFTKHSQKHISVYTRQDDGV